MDDGDLLASPIWRHIPVEICENVIDQLYSAFDFSEQIGNLHTLSRCALVCKNWRVRSQKALFYSVILSDVATIRRFAAALETGPHLSQYVYEVTLIGYTLHTTASPLWHFPVILFGKLPRLRDLRVRRIEDSTAWYPKASQPDAKQRL